MFLDPGFNPPGRPGMTIQEVANGGRNVTERRRPKDDRVQSSESSEGGSGGAHINRGMITLSIMMANIMQGVDNSILNVALPHIQGSLSASQDQVAWALTSYIVCAAIMMPLTGWLAGRFGIKYIFLVSVIGFTLASALCGAATSLGELVLFRALQGVCGAGLVPLSQATLLQINPPERHGRAMAVFGIGTILGPIMGPALGGWLTYEYSWRWVFYINLPVGMLCSAGHPDLHSPDPLRASRSRSISSGS